MRKKDTPTSTLTHACIRFMHAPRMLHARSVTHPSCAQVLVLSFALSRRWLCRSSTPPLARLHSPPALTEACGGGFCFSFVVAGRRPSRQRLALGEPGDDPRVTVRTSLVLRLARLVLAGLQAVLFEWTRGRAERDERPAKKGGGGGVGRVRGMPDERSALWRFPETAKAVPGPEKGRGGKGSRRGETLLFSPFETRSFTLLSPPLLHP